MPSVLPWGADSQLTTQEKAGIIEIKVPSRDGPERPFLNQVSGLKSTEVPVPCAGAGCFLCYGRLPARRIFCKVFSTFSGVQSREVRL